MIPAGTAERKAFGFVMPSRLSWVVIFTYSIISEAGSRRVSHGKPIAGIVPKDRKGWQPRLVIRG
jgi:hypothetical protein